MYTGNRSPKVPFPLQKKPGDWLAICEGHVGLYLTLKDLIEETVWKTHDLFHLERVGFSSSPGNRINVFSGDSISFSTLGYSTSSFLPKKIWHRRFSPLTGWVPPRETPKIGFESKVDCLARCGYTSLEFWRQVGRFYHSRLWPDTWWSDFGCQIVKHLGVWSFRTWQFCIKLLFWDSELSDPFKGVTSNWGFKMSHWITWYLNI